MKIEKKGEAKMAEENIAGEERRSCTGESFGESIKLKAKARNLWRSVAA